MKTIFKIDGVTKDENLVFYILNGKSPKEIENQMLDYVYHNAVFCLLIISKKYKDKSNNFLSDFAEHLEENKLFLAPGSIKFIMKKYITLGQYKELLTDIFTTLNDIINSKRRILFDENNQEWYMIQKRSRTVLEKLNVPIDYSLEEYEDNLDFSFLTD